MVDKQTDAAQVEPIVSQRPQYELLLRESGTSYSVAPQWAIGWVGNGWRVFYCCIDAAYRLTREVGMVFATFERAWTWIYELTEDEILTITKTSG